MKLMKIFLKRPKDTRNMVIYPKEMEGTQNDPQGLLLILIKPNIKIVNIAHCA